MDDNLRAQLEFEARRKSVGASYLLWFFLGFFGAHRFYLGRTGSGIAQLLLCLSVIGLIPLAFWWVIDAFLIPGMAEEENMKAIEDLSGGRDTSSLEGPAPRMETRSRDPRLDDPIFQKNRRREPRRFD